MHSYFDFSFSFSNTTSMPTTLCIHHAPCNDGSAAAAALALRLYHARMGKGLPTPNELVHEIEVMPLGFGKEWDSPIDEDYLEHLGHHDEIVEEIYIVDISLAARRFQQILTSLTDHGRIGETRPRVICIDHHRSAIDRHKELDIYCDETLISIGPGLSGATLVWNYFNEKCNVDESMPDLLRYVADQDIWEWKLPDSKAINSALNTLNGYLPAMAEELIESMTDPVGWKRARTIQGKSIIAQIESQIRRAFGRVHRFETDEGVEFMVVNSTDNSSQLGNHLCEESENRPNAVAMIYTVQDDWSVKVSVRSLSGGSLNARTVAEKFGGGGHDNAAGCRFGSFAEFQTGLDTLR